MATAVLEPISPELVLVCPELRALALAQMVDDAQGAPPLEASFTQAISPADEASTPAVVDEAPLDAVAARQNVLIAAFVYGIRQIVMVGLHGAAVVALVAAVLVIAELIHL